MSQKTLTDQLCSMTKNQPYPKLRNLIHRLKERKDDKSALQDAELCQNVLDLLEAQDKMIRHLRADRMATEIVQCHKESARIMGLRNVIKDIIDNVSASHPKAKASIIQDKWIDKAKAELDWSKK